MVDSWCNMIHLYSSHLRRCVPPTGHTAAQLPAAIAGRQVPTAHMSQNHSPGDLSKSCTLWCHHVPPNISKIFQISIIIYIPGAWKLAQLGYPICNSILWSKELFLTQEPYFWKGPCIEPFRVEHLYDTGLYTFIQVKLGKHPHIVLFHCHSPWHSLVWPQDCFWLLMEIWKC